MLIGKDFQLKISDFDMSSAPDYEIISLGTANYSAPELVAQKVTNRSAVDIYSAGIIFFLFKTFIFPYAEDVLYQGINFEELLHENPEQFWRKHEEISEGKIKFEKEFQELFIAMTQKNPMDRATIADIKNSKWYKEEKYSDQEIISLLTGKLQEDI